LFWVIFGQHIDFHLQPTQLKAHQLELDFVRLIDIAISDLISCREGDDDELSETLFTNDRFESVNIETNILPI